MDREPIQVNMARAIFFKNERHIGFDPYTNEPIYWGSRKRARIVPKIDPKTGEQEVRKHATTGVPLNKVNKVEGLYDEEFIYKKIDDTMGNVYRQSVEHPDVIRARYERKVEEDAADERGRELLREMVRSGVTPEQIRELGLVKAGVEYEDVGAEEEDELEAEAEAEEKAYPTMYGPGLWYLNASHEALVRAEEAKGFKGTGDAARKAADDLNASKAHTKASLDQVPTI